MSQAPPQDFFNQEDQGESILKEDRNNSKKSGGFDTKTIIEKIIEKLDRILAVVLILLLLLFFFQSSGQTQPTVITPEVLLKTIEPPVKVADPIQKTAEPVNIVANKQESSLDDDDDEEENKPKKGKTSKKSKQTKSKLKKNTEDSDDENDQEEGIKQSKRKSKQKKQKDEEEQQSQIDQLDDDQEEEEEKPKNKKGKKTNEQDSEQQQAPKKKKKKIDESDDEDSLQQTPRKKNKKEDLQDSDLDSQQQGQQPPKKIVKRYNKISQKNRLHQTRSQFFKTKLNVQHLQYLKLAKFNMDIPTANAAEQQSAFKDEQNRLQKKYKLSQTKEELSICTIVYSGTHKKLYGHQYVLNSVLNQKYDNFIVVFIADGYTGEDIEPVKLFIKEKDANEKVNLVWNTERKYFLESVMNAINDQCSKKKITVLVDGQDELLGRQVFRLLNAHYHLKTANVIYTNFIEYHQNEMQMKIGFSSDYEEIEKSDSRYRSVGQKFGSLKSFRTRLASYISEEDLKDQFNNFYRYAGDYALMYPLLELACGKIMYIPEYNYLYFGYQIDPMYGSIQISAGREIRDKDRYSCYKDYK